MVIFLFFFIPGRIHISPKDSIPLLEKDVRCEVEPSWLGSVRDGMLYAGSKEGIGVIRIGDEEIFLRVDRDAPPLIFPPIIRLRKGEFVELRLSREEEVLRWEVIPRYIGYVRDGVFYAMEDGIGRVIAITEKGISQARVEVGRIDFRVRITPKISSIIVGEEVRLRVDPYGKRIRWWVYPERGEIAPGGVFKAAYPGRYVIYVVVERDGKKGVGEAFVHVKGERIRVVPGGALLKVGEAKRFIAVAGGSRVRCRWKVLPNQGITFMDGVFIPERRGIYLVFAYPKDRELKPGIGICVVDTPPELRIYPDSIRISRNEEVKFEVYERGRVIWKVIPSNAGTITREGIFHPGEWKGSVKVVGVLLKGGSPFKWGVSRIFIE